MEDRYYEVNSELNKLTRELENTKKVIEEIKQDRFKRYKDRLNKIKDEECTEEGHIKADGILCDLLDELGYSEITEIFDSLDKWYS